MTYSVVGIDELLWDIFLTGKELGGAPANFVYHVSDLGGEGLIVSCVGFDHLGDEILERLCTLSLDYKYVTSNLEHPTGTSSVKVEPEGNPSFTIKENVAWDFIPKSQQLMELSKGINAVTFEPWLSALRFPVPLSGRSSEKLPRVSFVFSIGVTPPLPDDLKSHNN